MTSSFTATTPGGYSFRWDSKRGFSGAFGSVLNGDMQTEPLQTILPQAEIARSLVLKNMPGCRITDFVSQPLPPADPKAMT